MRRSSYSFYPGIGMTCFALLIQNFTLHSQILPIPRMITPSDQSELQVLGTRLQWEPISEATYYKLKIYADQSQSALIFGADVKEATVVAQNLDYDRSYYWTIQAYNDSRNSLESKARSFRTMPDNPHRVVSHPRLLFTQKDLPRLRAWATNSNPIFKTFKDVLEEAIQTYDTRFFPGGQANPNWPDIGNITWSSHVTESYAEFFAFWSLMDPDPSQRSQHAKRARNLLMYVIEQALLGPLTGMPFRDPQFMTYDRSRVYGEACPLTVDWIYNAKDESGNAILTAEDKSKIRTVFLRWCEDQLTAYNHPTPVGLINDKLIQLKNRWILNNYYSGHARNLLFMSLALDESDDQPLDPKLDYSALGNSVRSYLFNATGAWLYGQYAQYEYADTVALYYGMQAGGLGTGSGGLSVEGSLYGQSIGWVTQVMWALKTSGWLDEKVIGKQAKLFDNDYWTRLIDGLIHQTAPLPYIPPAEPYYGEIYPVANYGDVLRTWVTPDLIQITAPIGYLDQFYLHHQTRLEKCFWYTRNVLQGGAAHLLRRLRNTWPGSAATDAIYYFVLLDPENSNPPDPRPKMQLDFEDKSFHKIISRTDWTSGASWFNWQCHWTTINHQSGDGNQFEFYRKGEWLIKERSGYTNDGVGYTSEFHNTLGLQNTIPANLQWYEAPTIERGGQWTQGVNDGDPSVISCIYPDFIYATGDATNLYNRPNIFNAINASTDIEYAVRSLIWLKPDHIVVYDRAKSKTANRFKRFFLQFTAEPIVKDNIVTVQSPGNQKVYVTNLLPKQAVITPSVSEKIQFLAHEEFTTHQIKIEDPSNPQDIRFLNLIQGADQQSVADPVLHVETHLGTSFEGVLVQSTICMFPKVWGTNLDSMLYTCPQGVTKHIITGLQPKGGYQAQITFMGNLLLVKLMPGNEIFADKGGVLILKTGVNANHDENLKHSDYILISPNPVQNYLDICLNISEAGQYNVELYDVFGQKISEIIKSKFLDLGKHEFKHWLGDLKSGLYFLKLRSEYGNVSSFKFIKI